ncbi:MAG: endolytic transglycosylase MltG [Acidimicrobiia bacterium]|nr:endolytic transglycosylase MltG [Acidimicrobiia bacterium]
MAVTAAAVALVLAFGEPRGTVEVSAIDSTTTEATAREVSGLGLSPETTSTLAAAPSTIVRPWRTADVPATSSTNRGQAEVSSTTMAPETTTSSSPPASSNIEYSATPKPRKGPNTVAPGGALTKHLVADIAAAFGLATEDVETALGGVALPPEAGGNPEGWLAPGSYEMPGSATPGEVVQAMVDRRVAQLEQRGVPKDQWHRVITAASIIEKETYNQTEKPRVARVLVNRLAGGGPLQMDSIILYPVPEDRIFTTSAERASDQPYNSYGHNGRPPTPISMPDEASLDAFLTPPPGDWWFYVTIDVYSGETRYAVDYEDHLENVELLRAWLREHPTP